ncbi:MAG: proline--tRNA ligase [Phycisphaerae bacterium]
MRYSNLLIPTVKEVPADAEIPSHQLMVRAGFIRKVASGTYTYLPLGWKTLRKIMDIVRDEMNAAGAQEISMPVLQPMELWQQTGRDEVFEDIMCKFTDRHGRENVLSPTAEEVVTALAAAELKSYKQLPVNLYQINTKFRDEFRPRFGVLRSREFIMKDAYSFHAESDSLDETYNAMSRAYSRIFTRCGLPYVIVEAESGGMGGSGSQEFMVPCSAGEDIILSSDKGNYAANVEKAQTGDRPSDLTGEPTGDLEDVETPDCKSIEDVQAFFKKKLRSKLKAGNMLKTLVLRVSYEGRQDETDPDWVIAVIRGDHELNEFKLFEEIKQRHPNATAIEMAEEADAAAAGFAIGYVGPHALPEICKSVMMIDPDAAQPNFWVTGGNRKDLHVKHFNWQRDVVEPLGDAADSRLMVADIRNAIEGDPSPKNDGGVLSESHGIEIGHVFKLGTKYSQQLDATVLDENGSAVPCIMGCYGIGVNRIFASAIEFGHDENGCVLPINIAPFEVLVVPLNNDKPEVQQQADAIYNSLKDKGIDVLCDDRDTRPGVKFKDADLLGIPLRIVVGERGLKEGNVEIKRRTDDKPTHIDKDAAVERALAIVSEMKAALQPED